MLLSEFMQGVSLERMKSDTEQKTNRLPYHSSTIGIVKVNI